MTKPFKDSQLKQQAETIQQSADSETRTLKTALLKQDFGWKFTAQISLYQCCC